MGDLLDVREQRRWPRGLLWAAAASGLGAIGLAFGLDYFSSLPEDGTDAAGMMVVSLAFMFVGAVGASVALVVAAATHRFARRTLKSGAARRS